MVFDGLEQVGLWTEHMALGVIVHCWDSGLRRQLRHASFIEKGVRGGISQCCNRYAIANNRYMSNFNPDDEIKYLMYLDANNLYGYAMSKYLPLKDFVWSDNDLTEQDILNLSDESDVGENNSTRQQLNSEAGTKQLNSPVGTKQLNSSVGTTTQLCTAVDRLQRLQPPATAYNRLQPPAPPLQQNRLFLPTSNPPPKLFRQS
ncbi:uncharacterized protein TNCV_4145551 [Trichonephila clavipes]|nr:uncharacterized protein TNCV_4145551 [Trichonephila clavipes]